MLRYVSFEETSRTRSNNGNGFDIRVDDDAMFTIDPDESQSQRRNDRMIKPTMKAEYFLSCPSLRLCSHCTAYGPAAKKSCRET